MIPLKRLNKLYLVITPLVILAVTTAIVALPYDAGIFSLILIAMGVVALATFAALILYEHRLQREIDNTFGENAVVSKQIVTGMGIPCAFCTTAGRVVWRNNAFLQVFDGKSLKKIMTDRDLTPTPHTFQKQIGSHSYAVVVMPVTRSNPLANDMLFIYLQDRTEVLQYAKLYEDNLPTVALIYVDNYEDLSAETGFSRNEVINEVERAVSQLAKSVYGVYRRSEGAKFMLIFEASRLRELEEKRFEILNIVHSINTGTATPPTLSIGIGRENAIAQSYDSAKNAMELALGRGGDQAVVKYGQNYRFYGGRNISTTKISRVRVRSIAGALRELMETTSDIYIMGHKRPDLDCVGAALGVMHCAVAINKKAYYVTEGGKQAVEEMLDMELSKPLAECIKTPAAALETFRGSPLLVIVDTQREHLLCEPELCKKTDKIVVIDHHRRAADSISNVTVNYTEPASSSASEMVTEILQCFYDKPRGMSQVATALLAGICLDTKSFVFNTGARTFDAAGYLRQCGADTGKVKRMFQDDIGIFVARARAVEAAEFLEGGIALSQYEDETLGDGSVLIAAQAADSLMSIRGVTAAFVLTPLQNMVSVSARSLGTINVQRICEKVGGGGHLTVAGAQITNVTLSEARELMKNIIEAYMKEENLI